MNISLTKIGNSKGIIIPKALLDKYDFENKTLELRDDDGRLTIQAVRKPREGWEEAIIAAGVDELSEEDLEWLNMDDGIDIDKDIPWDGDLNFDDLEDDEHHESI